MVKLFLPEKSVLVDTSHEGEEDPVNHYYKPLISYVYKKRLKLCLRLINRKKFEKILDIGYGSGIFFPTLQKICKKLYGLDEHEFTDKVSESMRKIGIESNLVSADLMNIPFEDNFFDAVISISTYEHIKDLESAMKELYRVLKKEGHIYIGVPVKNNLTNAFFNLVGKHLPTDEMHPSSHKDVIEALKKKFKIKNIITFPKFLPLNYSFYVVVEAIKK